MTNLQPQWQNKEVFKWWNVVNRKFDKRTDEMKEWRIDETTKWRSNEMIKWQIDRMTNFKIPNIKMTKYWKEKVTNWRNVELTISLKNSHFLRKTICKHFITLAERLDENEKRLQHKKLSNAKLPVRNQPFHNHTYRWFIYSDKNNS